MLLFGGRSAEHDVSRVTAVAVARGARSRAYEVVPVGDHDRRAVAARGRGAGACSRRAATRCPAAFDGRGRRGRAADGPGAPSSCRATRRGARRRRRVPAAARSVRRGRHGAGPARARRTCRTSASGVLGSAVGMDKIMMKRAFAAAGLPHRARTSRSATATTRDAFADRGRGRARVPVLREAVEHGLVGRRVEGARPRPSSTPRSRARSSSTSGSSPRRWSPAARSRSRCSATTRRRRRCPARSCPAPSSTTTPTSTRTARRSCSRPAPLDDAETARGARARGAGVRGVPVRGDGARRLLPTPTTGLRRERAQHDPRVHADLDVPAAVGGRRACRTRELLDRLIELAIARHARRARRGGRQR